jgi:hypothetical protein
MTRPAKKSETLEIRLPFETKTAFMARCRDEGLTASEAVRTFIDQRLSGAERRGPRGWRRRAQAAAGVLVLLGAGATALPSLAGTLDRAGFSGLDRNGDGRLSRAEFSAAGLHLDSGPAVLADEADAALRRQVLDRAFRASDANGDGAVTFVEYRQSSR